MFTIVKKTNLHRQIIYIALIIYIASFFLSGLAVYVTLNTIVSDYLL